MYSPFFSAPAWSLRSKPQHHNNKQQTHPDLATYHPHGHGDTKKNPPSFSFGNQNRSTFQPHKGPGPGYYQTQNTFNPASITMLGRSNSVYNPTASNPGPGQYNPSKNGIRPKQPSFSMGGKDMTNFPNKNPGVGQYGIGNQIKQADKGASIGKSERQPLDGGKKGKIGPGNYQLTYQPFNKGPSYKIPEASRVPEKDEGNLPGRKIKLLAGLYNTGKNLSQNRDKGYTMLSRKANPQQINRNYVPGPGAQQFFITSNQQDKRKRGTSYSIGQQQRKTFKTSTNPGPGQYDVNYNTKNKQQSKIGKGQRNQITSKYKTPGPGSYQLTKQIGNKKISILGAKTNLQSKQIIQNPGPGQYDHNKQGNKADSTKIGIGTSHRSGLGYGSQTPGPGDYSAMYGKDGPKWSFAYGERLKYGGNKNPGPPDYKIPSLIADLPNYVLNSKGFSKYKQ